MSERDSPPCAQIPRRFRDCRELGRGGMGVVYRGFDTKMDREVALKVLSDESFGDDVSRRIFRNEARTIAQLNHPSIAIAYDLESSQSGDVLVLELIEGEALDDRVLRGALDEALVRTIGAQTAEGLAYAHARGVIHRDVKPGNLMLIAGDRVKILDFGLAKRTQRSLPATSSSGPLIDATSVFVGTLGYVAPEQLRGEDVDARADVYGLGATLFHLLAGRPPFIEEDVTLLSAAVLERAPPMVGSVRPGVSRAFEALIAQCLSKSPSQRPSAEEVAERLRPRPKSAIPAAAGVAFFGASLACFAAASQLPARWIGLGEPSREARREVEVHSTPPGARVFIDGEPLGLKTPVTLVAPRPGATLSLQLQGHATGVQALDERVGHVELSLEPAKGAE